MTFDRYVGIPAANLGRNPCWGLVRRVIAERAGVILPAYDTVTDHATVIAEDSAGEEWLQIVPGEERPLDVAIMSGLAEREGKRGIGETHVGLITAPGHVLHVEQDKSSVCVPYNGRVKRIIRHRSLA